MIAPQIATGLWLTVAALIVAPEDDAPAIRQVLDRQVAAWNRGDLDGFLDGYWRAPGVVFLSGNDRIDGWEAIRDRYLKRYRADGKAMGTLTFSDLEIEPLGPEAAFARGGWRLALPDDKRAAGQFTLILRRFPAGWRIVHDHTSAAAP